MAERGPEQTDLHSLLGSLDPDVAGSIDGVHDADNQPLTDEPRMVRQDLGP